MDAAHEFGGEAVVVGVRGDFRPADGAEHGQVQADEQDANDQRAPDDRPRDRAARIADLVADVADVVIAEVGIDREDHRRPELPREVGRPRRRRSGKVEGDRRVEPRPAFHEDPGDREHHADPKGDREPAERRDLAEEQQHDR